MPVVMVGLVWSFVRAFILILHLNLLLIFAAWLGFYLCLRP